MTGKWFNYGILFIVMILDMNMWKNQIFYTPLAFGQYVGPDDRIHSVYDEWSLSHYNNETIYSYDWRSNNIDPLTNLTYFVADGSSNSRYRGYSLSLRALAFIPSILVLIMFVALIIIFGREGTKQFEKPRSRTTSEKVIGIRMSQVDPDSDMIDGHRSDVPTENEQEDEKPPEKSYGATDTSSPSTIVVASSEKKNSDEIA